jgi:hypothetical protein
MDNPRIPITRQGGVVIGYTVSEHRSEHYLSESGHWFQSGSGTGHIYSDWKKASAAFRKALKRGSCCCSVNAIVIPERLPS